MFFVDGGFLYKTTDELTNILEIILKSKFHLNELDFEEMKKLNKGIISKFSEDAFFDRLTNILL